MIEIKRIKKESASRALRSINGLLPQLSPSGKAAPLTLKELDECLDNKNFYLFAATDSIKIGEESIVGVGSIFFQRNLGRWIAEIHDIVVATDQRGHGLGEKMVKRLIGQAKSFARSKGKPIKLYLTSRPSRVAANQLYVKLNFVQVAEAKGEWGTNLYKMVIRPENDISKNPAS